MKCNNQRLYRLAHGIVRDDAEVEDVVQEAYVSAFAHLDRFRGDSALATWLSRIVINEALGRLRKRKRQAAAAARPDPAMGQVIEFPNAEQAGDPESWRRRIRSSTTAASTPT